MAIIDLVEWLNTASEPVYAWKFRENNLSTYTQLIVRESQEAVLFSKGRLIGKFGPGKHTLDTENLRGCATSSASPSAAEPFYGRIWSVNKLLPLNIDWETDGMPHHDPDYQTMVPLVAKGQYGLRVDDAERFLVQLWNRRPVYSGRIDPALPR